MWVVAGALKKKRKKRKKKKKKAKYERGCESESSALQC